VYEANEGHSTLMSGISTPSVPVAADDPASRRVDVRWGFKGTAFPVRMGKKHFEIRLKDLSRGGACGLMEEPVAIGDYVMIELDERHVVEAQVCWVRRVMVGLKFSNPLTAAFVSRVHRRAAKQPEPEDDPYLIVPRRRPKSA
jgi:hypothetical protein